MNIDEIVKHPKGEKTMSEAIKTNTYEFDWGETK